MHIWLQGMFLLCSSKKGMSSNQLHRVLGITLKSAWFMSHRIRKAMEDGSFSPLGGLGKIVEADETEISPSRKTWVKGGRARGKNPRFVSLIERGGKVRSKVIRERGLHEVRHAVRENVDQDSYLHTDGAPVYRFLMPMGQHESVDHNKQFARNGETGRVHCNSAEGYFSLFKRGLVGTYQHMGEQHLSRYLAEFDFRYTNRVAAGIDDQGRTLKALDGVTGKRLTYRELTQ